jgi:hypothetical protein
MHGEGSAHPRGEKRWMPETGFKGMDVQTSNALKIGNHKDQNPVLAKLWECCILLVVTPIFFCSNALIEGLYRDLVSTLESGFVASVGKGIHMKRFRYRFGFDITYLLYP